jgi:hypothetical protein
MINNLIVFIHILISILNTTYGFIVQNKRYDYIFLTCIFLLLLHWTFFKGECIVSYWFKKIQNNDYELGSDFKNDDFQYVFGNYRFYAIFVINIIMMLNIYIVAKRNNIKKHIILLFILLFQTYIFGIYGFTNHNTNTNFQLFNEIIKILLILFGIYFYINNSI